MLIDPGLLARFGRQLASGSVVLFTGAGFSRDVVAVDGRALMDVAEMVKELERLTFGSSPGDDEGSSLADLFELANARAGGPVQRLFESRLRVDASRTPARFADWFSMPWKRHYTLNIDDLDEAINSQYPLPRSLKSVSGYNHSAVQTPDLLSVHLNGRLADFPNITFGTRQYAQRSITPDPWYEILTSDLLTSPILFVGTVLSEQSLWQHIEMRRSRQAGDVELRPPSYLVSPSLPRARAALLKRYNIDWIQATEAEFFAAALANAATEAERGRQAIARLHHPVTASSSLRPVSALRQQPPATDPRLFLQGREPEWSDVQEDGYAIVRSFEGELAEAVRASPNHVFLLTGTAASGKTTTAMRLALALQAGGKSVVAYDGILGSRSASQVLQAARHAAADAIFVDDVDVFGDSTGRLLADLVAIPRVSAVIATLRSSRMQGLSIENELETVAWSETTIPQLVDEDIDLILQSLERAGSLGRMTGMDPDARRRLLREQAGRQLVVAMFYATNGEQLEDRIRGECEDLAGSARLAYGLAALATAEHQYVTSSEMLVGLGVLGYGNEGNHALNEMDRLVQRNLLVRSPRGLQVRHRWIAEKTLEFFTDNGLLHKVILAFSFALASEVDPQTSRHTRERRLIRRLINHDRLQRQVVDLDHCREIYVELQDRLMWDYHYWLQRGSLEVECGDLSQAKVYLESARSLTTGSDRWVENEYAYLLLKNAARDPSASQAFADVQMAFSHLEDAMRTRGATDAYPYHVYGSQGLGWARRAPLPPQDRVALLGKLLAAVEEGRRYHPRRDDLKQLESDLRREYLYRAAAL